MIHIADERDISPTHKFYGPLPDVDIEQDEQEVGLLYSMARSVFRERGTYHRISVVPTG